MNSSKYKTTNTSAITICVNTDDLNKLKGMALEKTIQTRERVSYGDLIRCAITKYLTGIEK